VRSSISCQERTNTLHGSAADISATCAGRRKIISIRSRAQAGPQIEGAFPQQPVRGHWVGPSLKTRPSLSWIMKAARAGRVVTLPPYHGQCARWFPQSQRCLQSSHQGLAGAPPLAGAELGRKLPLRRVSFFQRLSSMIAKIDHASTRATSSPGGIFRDSVQSFPLGADGHGRTVPGSTPSRRREVQLVSLYLRTHDRIQQGE